MQSTLPGPVSVKTQNESELKLEFVGNAHEYFRVWVVNLCLTLITFGIFSAWAKVRKQRYFYSRTLLDGTPFQYLGQPIPIFRGRLIAVVLFAIYYATQYVAPAMNPYMLAGALVLTPWIIARSAAFKARYTAYRNMTFGFNGNYEQAIKAIYWLGGIPFLVICIMFDSWSDFRIIGVAVLIAALLFPWWLCRLKRFIVSHTTFGGRLAVFSATGWQFFKIYFLSGLIVSVGAAIAGLSVFALEAKNQTAIVAAMVPVYFFYVVAFAFVRARTFNLTWNRSQIGPIAFHSTLRTGGLFALYLGNAVGIIVSLGLLTPWAVIRTMRYRAQNLTVMLNGSLEYFRGSQLSAVHAAGAEVGDLFDMELSL